MYATGFFSRASVVLAAACAVLALIAVSPVRADAFEDGMAALRQGDFAGAVAIWTPLAENGHAEAQYRLGFAHAGGWGVPENPRQAAAWYLLAAAQGHAAAYVQLGHMYADGRHFPQSDTTAANWYRRAAGAGNPDGQYYLGSFYYEGRGVPRDFGEAYRMWQLAIAQGHEGARGAMCAEIADFCR